LARPPDVPPLCDHYGEPACGRAPSTAAITERSSVMSSARRRASPRVMAYRSIRRSRGKTSAACRRALAIRSGVGSSSAACASAMARSRKFFSDSVLSVSSMLVGTRGRPNLFAVRCSRNVRQREAHGRARGRLARDVEATAVALDDPASERQAKSDTSGGPRPAAIAAEERRPHMRQIGGGGPAAPVRQPPPHPPAPSARAPPPPPPPPP